MLNGMCRLVRSLYVEWCRTACVGWYGVCTWSIWRWTKENEHCDGADQLATCLVSRRTDDGTWCQHCLLRHASLAKVTDLRCCIYSTLGLSQSNEWCMISTIHGDHLSGKPRKPGNVREFDSHQGHVRDFTKSPWNVREEMLSGKSCLKVVF